MNWCLLKLTNLLNLGISTSLTPLDIIRSRLINAINYIFLVAACNLLIYRLYLQDLNSALTNFVLILFLLFSLSLCKKGKQQSSILLFVVLILFLNIDLYYDGFYFSALIYLTLIPLFLSIVLDKKLLRHAIFLSCLILFAFYEEFNNTNLVVTYYFAMIGCYLGVINFVNFLEANVVLLQVSIHEKTVANQALQLKNEELKQFSFICSHHLKQPIQNISNFVQLVNKKFEQETLIHDYADYFYFINNGVIDVSNLLEQIRVYFEVDNNENTTCELVDIAAVFKLALEDLSYLKEENNVIIQLNNQTATDTISCPKFVLRLLLKNLIQNAIQFNNSEQPVVKVSFKQEKQLTIISVADNGMGVEKEFHSYIFEPFNTLGNKNINKPAGLGLAICEKIITVLDGEIWLESTPGFGSIFYVSFNHTLPTNV